MINKKFSKKTDYITPKMDNIHNIHFIGIGGFGMGGIAYILVKQGYKISGSDIISNEITNSLISLGVKIYFQHNAKNINNTNVVVVSSAIKDNNPEIIAAKKNNIIIISRAKMLSEIMRFYYSITITGSHGKTTTTAMIYYIYSLLGFDPTFINGGILKKSSLYAHLGKSKYFIAEADESDASFLNLRPIINVITNIEDEHLEYYQYNIEILKKNFLNYLKNIPFYGCIIICIDNLAIRDLLKNNLIHNNIITYGFSKDADIKIYNYQQCNLKSKFNLLKVKENISLEVSLNLPGKHNVLNATAAFAVSSYTGMNYKNILKALENFSGIKRRFDILGTFEYKKNNLINNITLIEDYGHHPTEINVTINTVREIWPQKKIIMIFQPHRYSRTANLLNKFIKTLSTVDVLFILNVYSAGEDYISGGDSISLYKGIKNYGKINPIFGLGKNYHEIIINLYSKFTKNDILLIQGAGDINKISSLLVKKKFKL
ncbi:UDP-N-acetylmuramate--L-alanine ligase [Enterobacteriaceae endosymbiont of Plateumaris braccata]|uniref:UDP-N-acetylmuramate--L-alanine ligase n=1 Tax=Enterobacteriaceae endosymbiont of Plateumaris braccata TaxID=2675793 RepID=UPI001449264C|nr:UDP-N-acetylmuramate--L-alanine ligase [Enterobacteriaceae endosymbiont of Plateumaris braccata]QJC28104.1 UDP-N-acetylmuramate--L-alanine ligase [Enterobacteriaceae endosymbiont of Plateumaris braccata]